MRLGTGTMMVTWTGSLAPFGTTEPSALCPAARLTTVEMCYSTTWADGGLKTPQSRY